MSKGRKATKVMHRQLDLCWILTDGLGMAVPVFGDITNSAQ